MPSLKPRLDRLEARAPLPEAERIPEVHYRVIEPNGTPARNPDGTPMLVIHAAFR